MNKRRLDPGVPLPRLLKIDLSNNEIVGQLDFDEFISAVRVVPDGRVIVTEMRFPEPGSAATGPICGRIHIVDPDAMKILTTLGADELPFTTRCSDDSSHAFVSNLKTGSVTVVDLSTYEIAAILDNNMGHGFGGTHGICFIPTPG